MAHRVIVASLSDMDRAAREVLAYRDELQLKLNRLLTVLSEDGAEYARMQVATLGAVYTGGLLDSIEGYYSASEHCGIIKAGAWYAAFVEYGTGVVGANSPHPSGNGWAYDVNGHGEAGWHYMLDEQWHWTRGMPSRPFMYNTVQELERICQTVAMEVFGA